MKRSLTLSLLFCSFHSFGQVTFDTTQIKLKYRSASTFVYFLDSTKIDIQKTYIDVDNIKTISVIKDTTINYATKPYYKVFLYSINTNHNWSSLNDFKIIKSHSDTFKTKVFIIDGQLISDTSNVRLETSAVKSVDTINTTENPEAFHGNYPKAVFVITTKASYKVRKQKNGH